jgi:hypothetical protein
MCQYAALGELLLSENHNEKAENNYVIIHIKRVVCFRFSVSTSSSLLRIQVKSLML